MNRKNIRRLIALKITVQRKPQIYLWEYDSGRESNGFNRFSNKIKPLNLDNKLASMKILIKGRDEVHRFVIKYHRGLRKLK